MHQQNIDFKRSILKLYGLHNNLDKVDNKEIPNIFGEHYIFDSEQKMWIVKDNTKNQKTSDKPAKTLQQD